MIECRPSCPLPVATAARFYAAYFGVLGVVLPFLGPFLVWRGVGAVGVGLITAGFSLGRVLYAPLLGARVDRGWWFRGLLAAHLALAVVAATALAGVEGQLLLGLAVVLVGLGYGTVLPLVEAAVLDRLPASGYGGLRLWGSIGFVLVGSVAGQVLGRLGVVAFPWLLVAVLVVLLASVRLLEESARPLPRTGAGRLPAPVWCLLALLTAHQVAHGPYYAFLSIHLAAHGFGSGAISAAWSLGVVAELLAFTVGGRLERRLGLRRLMTVALLLSPLRWLLLALPLGLPTLVVAQLGHAVSFALVHLAGVQLVQRSVPAGSVRHAQALYSGLTFGLGAVVGSALAGPLYARVGGEGSFAAAALLSLVVAGAAVPVLGKLSADGGELKARRSRS